LELFGKRSGAAEDCFHAANIVGGGFRALRQHYDYRGRNLEIRDLEGLDCVEEVCVDELFHYVDLRVNEYFQQGMCWRRILRIKFSWEMKEMT